MISRRDFLVTGAMGAAAVASCRLSEAEGSGTRSIGVQLYVLRAMLAKDFDGTLAKVAAIGIRNVEFAGFYGRSAKPVRESLSKAGLTASGAQCLFATSRTTTSGVPSISATK